MKTLKQNNSCQMRMSIVKIKEPQNDFSENDRGDSVLTSRLDIAVVIPDLMKVPPFSRNKNLILEGSIFLKGQSM